jgi:GNAT superfamily N-acetyltransferase
VDHPDLPRTTPQPGLSEADAPALRSAEPADAWRLLELERATNVVALAHIFPPDRYPSPDADVLAHWRIMLDDPGVAVLIAEQEGRTVGYVAFDAAWVRQLAVHPDRWGTGVAEGLMSAALMGIAAAGSARARLWVLADNTRARRFYERTGWFRGVEESTSPYPPYPVTLNYWHRA